MPKRQPRNPKRVPTQILKTTPQKDQKNHHGSQQSSQGPREDTKGHKDPWGSVAMGPTKIPGYLPSLGPALEKIRLTDMSHYPRLIDNLLAHSSCSLPGSHNEPVTTYEEKESEDKGFCWRNISLTFLKSSNTSQWVIRVISFCPNNSYYRRNYHEAPEIILNWQLNVTFLIYKIVFSLQANGMFCKWDILL